MQPQSKAFKLTSSAALALALTSLVSACSSTETKEASPQTKQTELASVIENEIDLILPTQEEIKADTAFPYLNASASVEDFSASAWQSSETRVPNALKEKMSKDENLQTTANEKCGVYEQAAPGLITTPGASLSAQDGKTRAIALGAAGTNYVSGSNNIFRFSSVEEAEKFLSDFKSDAPSCSAALSALYPEIKDQFKFSSTIEDSENGTTILSGTYQGQTFYIWVYQKNNYMLTTWFSTKTEAGVDLMTQAGETIQKLAIENIKDYS